VNWLLLLFVALPVTLLFWYLVGFVLSLFLGPLGFVIAFVLMLHYSRYY
jgi:hypothetical protein